MTELSLTAAFLAGLLGSAHCLGMCGPFALLIATGTPPGGRPAVRQSVFSIGRVAAYTFLGTLAGFGSAWLVRRQSILVSASAWLAIVAGIILAFQGFASLGWFRLRSRRGPSPVLCRAARLYRSLLISRTLGPVLLAGMLTALLPCGLLYGMVALAASTQSVILGGAIMSVFGLGTVPALGAFGWTSGKLSVAWRARIWRLAACAVLLAGLMTIGRGVVALARSPAADRVCPLCQDASEPSEASPNRPDVP